MSGVVGRGCGGQGYERYRVGAGGGYWGRGIGWGTFFRGAIPIMSTVPKKHMLWSMVISSTTHTYISRSWELPASVGATNCGGLSLSGRGRAKVSVVKRLSTTTAGDSSERMSGVVGVVAILTVGSRLEARLRRTVRPSTWKSPSCVRKHESSIGIQAHRTHR